VIRLRDAVAVVLGVAGGVLLWMGWRVGGGGR